MKRAHIDDLCLLPKATLIFAGLMWAAQAVGLTWTATGVWGLAPLALILAFHGFRRNPSPPSDRGPFHRLENLGVVAVLGILLPATALGWNIMSDYVFHWGAKAKSFAAVGGIDYEILALPWNDHLHPDYPNLLPTLYSGLMIAFDASSWATVAVVPMAFLVVFVVACRRLAEAWIGDPLVRLPALAAVLGGVLGFAVQPMVVGGADLMIALAALLGSAALVAPADRHSDRQVAWIAAFAAACKLEGIIFAAVLLALQGLRRLSTQLPQKQLPQKRAAPALWAAGLAWSLAWPFALVVGHWGFRVWQYRLFLESNTAGLDLQRLGTVISGVAAQMVDPVWHGLPLVLVALPWLIWFRATRWAALWSAIQGGFYLYVYLAGPVDTALWIQTSAGRLFFHLVPACALLLAASVTPNDASTRH